jgi:hypothetical protein
VVIVAGGVTVAFATGSRGDTERGTQAGAAMPQATAATIVPPKPPTATEQAGALRRAATVACRAAQWDKCRANLDEAAKLDPEGDKVIVVQRLRKAAEQSGQ